ncbi:MAG: choice-of-anchor Q domain-containing protein [Polyangia bacterium]
MKRMLLVFALPGLAFALGGCMRDNPGFTGGGADSAAPGDLSGTATDGAPTPVDGGIDLAGCIPTGPEICDGIDNDCNGLVDDNIAGVGVACGSHSPVDGCVEKTVCVPSEGVVCLGTFVSPAGAPGNPGTKAAPLDTISAAIENATLIGGGANVCACDPNGGGATSYTEDITMVEGVSVRGGYSCDNQFGSRDLVNNATRIVDTDPATGLKFPAGLTGKTALDGMGVVGAANASGSSVAIAILDASPRLIDVIAAGGAAPASVAVYVGHTTGGGPSAPTITRGSYSAAATAGAASSQFGFLVEGGAPQLSGVVVQNGGAAAPVAAYSAALRCQGDGCAGAKLDNVTLDGGGATGLAAGLWASGAVDGLTVGNSKLTGGVVSAASGFGIGAFLDMCSGAPSFSANPSLQGGSGATGTLVGFAASGAACRPTVSASALRGCETGGACLGLSCDGAPCAVSGGTIDGATSATQLAAGVRCSNGGCASLTGITINAGALGAGNGVAGVGVSLDGASPTLDRDLISAPSCPTGGPSASSGPFYAVYLHSTTARLINNILRDRPCGAAEEVAHFDATDAAHSPILNSNTLEYTTCALCGKRVGLGLTAGNTQITAGVVRNNIIYNAGGIAAGSPGGTVIDEETHDIDLAELENNDLYDPLGTLYVDENSKSYNSIALIESNLTNASGNLSAAPAFDGANPYHLTAGSPCVNVGLATGAPNHDYDNDARPQQGAFDVGADEYKP